MSCVTFWREKRWFLKQNPALGERKLKFHPKLFSLRPELRPLLTKGQADLLKILFSTALITDSEFLFMQIFCHAWCFIAHIR